MGKCCIPGCRNSRERIPGLTFHQIPSNEPYRTSWIEALTKAGVKAFTEWTLVCGEHFRPEDYKMTVRKNFLLPSAVPSTFTIKPCKNAPKKRGRKPNALLQQQQEQLAAARAGAPQRVTVLRSVVAEGNDFANDGDEDYDPVSDGVRRRGRPRKRKVFTDMVVYMPKLTSDDQRDENGQTQAITLTFPREDGDDRGERVDATSSSGTLETSEAVRSEAVASDAEALQGSEDVTEQQPPKNLNVIVFTNQARPASTSTNSRTDDHSSAGAVVERSSDYPGNPRRRCCQIQTQRLLFYKSVITKLRKRVLALEASLAEKEKELASVEAQGDPDMVL
ncbi:uncharacterized protein LOC119180977 [Rhipicephalus microplus]|uniref:uncharacterized protein LOC119180977 n=1 Tax=Rhipicephalus microplus TaxID=6941 RepID=UPI003F6AC564